MAGHSSFVCFCDKTLVGFVFLTIQQLFEFVVSMVVGSVDGFAFMMLVQCFVSLVKRNYLNCVFL